MMRPDELELKMRALQIFKTMVETYEKMVCINRVDLYYDSHSMTRHGSITDGDEVSRVVRAALVERWWEKIVLGAANLRSHGVDPTSLMPKASK